MAFLNDHYLKLKAGYLFPEIARRVKVFAEANPEAAKRIIAADWRRDRAAAPAVVKAMHAAVDEMATREGFHGYGPEQGYEWLRHTIAENDYRAHGLEWRTTRVFVSDGSKCDLREYPRYPRRKEPHRDHRPGLPSLCGYERDGRAHRRGRRKRRLCGLVYLPCSEANGSWPSRPRSRLM